MTAAPASDVHVGRSITGQGVAHSCAVVALVWTGLFMTTLDASIVNIGLPTIARAFGTPLSGTIEWVIIGYLVVTAALHWCGDGGGRGQAGQRVGEL